MSLFALTDLRGQSRTRLRCPQGSAHLYISVTQLWSSASAGQRACPCEEATLEAGMESWCLSPKAENSRELFPHGSGARSQGPRGQMESPKGITFCSSVSDGSRWPSWLHFHVVSSSTVRFPCRFLFVSVLPCLPLSLSLSILLLSLSLLLSLLPPSLYLPQGLTMLHWLVWNLQEAPASSQIVRIIGLCHHTFYFSVTSFRIYYNQGSLTLITLYKDPSSK